MTRTPPDRNTLHRSAARTAAGLAGVLSLGMLCSACDGEPPVVQPEAELSAYYLDSYDASRERFLKTSDILEEQYDGVARHALSMPSATDDDLTIDVTLIPAQEQPQGALILTLGVHGVEAFAGSAVIQMLTAELLPSIDLAHTSVLMVHSVNPWGMRHHRRVNENNVDLNRNLSVTPELFDIVNAPYTDIDPFLNPAEVVSQQTVDDAFPNAVAFAVNYDRDELQQAILQGQYAHPLGMFYGGQTFEPSRQLLDPIFREVVQQHDKVFLMDFHTGFGERGKLHLFGAPGLGTKAAMATVFEGYTIDTGEGNENFYETYGDMILYLGEMAAEESTTYLGMTMEYGTLDSHTDLGAVQSLVNAQLENQGFHHGYSDSGVRQQVEQTFLESYFPIEQDWRTKIMEDTRVMLPVLIDRFITQVP